VVAPGDAHSPGELRIELLGPVEAVVDGRPVGLGGQRARALVALLAVRPGRVVANEDLADALWGDDPPARARESLQMHVSRLRKALAAVGADTGRLRSHAGGYRLDLRRGERDVDAWEDALHRVHSAGAAGDPTAARAELDAALRLWRGQPLGGVALNRLLAAERARLDEERLAALLVGIELDLELGHHGELLGQLDALVIAHPFAERLVELQMLALYRSGRQADALAAFHRARGRFVAELGIEPGERLRALHEDVLRHSPQLAAPAGTAPMANGAEAPRAPAAAGRADRRLPIPPNRTVGRGAELVEIVGRLQSGRTRLLTLTGPGGVGKTRVAIEAARAVEGAFADGVAFVSLAPLRSADEVPTAVVDAVGAIVRSGETVEQAAERFLAAKALLLVIDNFEHVLGGAPFVAGLLGACPALTVLATSREPLAVQSEECHLLAPLARPAARAIADPKALAAVDAVALFCERAGARDAGFTLNAGNAAAVAELCRRLDGLPLAIELAAARCGLLSPAEIAARLDEALATPGAGARDAAARQQTLRATVDWSHALLGDDEKACFAAFAVFAGGATVDAAETITGAGLGTIEGLLAKSLLVRRRHADAPTRLHMLETIRAYAAGLLAAGADGDAIHERHYRHFLAYAERHGSERVLMGAGRRASLSSLYAEVDNLHAALEWAVGRPDAWAALELCVALGAYWWMSSRNAEGMSWIDRALALRGAGEHPALRVRALCSKALIAWPLWLQAETGAAVEEAERTARELGDPLTLSLALQVRARIDATEGHTDLGVTDAMADEALALATAADDPWATAMAAYATAITATTIERQRACVRRAVTLLAEAGNDYHLARVLAASSYNAMCLGSDDDARDYARRVDDLLPAMDDPLSREFILSGTAFVTVITGDTDAAERAFRELTQLGRDHAAARAACDGLLGLAAIAALRGDDDRCARLVGAATSHRADVPLDEVESRLDEEIIQPARVRRGASAWDASLHAGEALTFDEAIAYALDEPQFTEEVTAGN
jgi:predicted ATPase/DNA-binding SARP family transcriptional activator